jgi:hypothetical protein
MRKSGSSPKYTRRHYIDIAETLTCIQDERERMTMANSWCEKFAMDNPRFKRDLFMRACELE